MRMSCYAHANWHQCPPHRLKVKAHVRRVSMYVHHSSTDTDTLSGVSMIRPHAHAHAQTCIHMHTLSALGWQPDTKLSQVAGDTKGTELEQGARLHTWLGIPEYADQRIQSFRHTLSHTNTHTRVVTHKHAHTRGCAQANAYTHTLKPYTHTRTHVLMHTYTRAHTRTHAYAHTRIDLIGGVLGGTGEALSKATGSKHFDEAGKTVCVSVFLNFCCYVCGRGCVRVFV